MANAASITKVTCIATIMAIACEVIIIIKTETDGFSKLTPYFVSIRGHYGSSATQTQAKEGHACAKR